MASYNEDELVSIAKAYGGILKHRELLENPKQEHAKHIIASDLIDYILRFRDQVSPNLASKLGISFSELSFLEEEAQKYIKKE